RVGPDLSGEGQKGRSKEWLRTQIRNPKEHDPRSAMPANSALNDQQVHQLVAYLLSLTGTSAAEGGEATTALPSPAVATVATPAVKLPGKAAFIIGSAEHGALLYEKNCTSCHGPRGAGQVPNPGSTDGTVPALNPVDRNLFNENPQFFASNIDLAIQYGSQPAGPHPALVMPAALTQEEIADLEAYILALNGVPRGEIMHPGIEPMKFLFAVSALFLVLVTIVLYRLNAHKRS
ncbi:MAG: hypothetical protein EHM79_06695, partial [Geobacter sp.]